jgi:hypothetical protein
MKQGIPPLAGERLVKDVNRIHILADTRPGKSGSQGRFAWEMG